MLDDWLFPSRCDLLPSTPVSAFSTASRTRPIIETAATLLPILIADVINPVLFASLVYAAGSGRPLVDSSARLLGRTATCFAAGIAIALGLEQITGLLANPRRIDYLLGLVVGILLLWIAFRAPKSPSRNGRRSAGC